MYRFSSDGFFGYGEDGDFKPFTLPHFIMKFIDKKHAKNPDA